MKKDLRKKIFMIWKFLKSSKRFFLVSIVFTVITALVDMVIPQIVRFSIDSVIGGKVANLPVFLIQGIEKIGGFVYLKANFWMLAMLIIVIALIKVFSQYMACVCNSKGTETFSKTTRDNLFFHITQLPYSWYSKNRTGDIIQRCTSDISTINEFLSMELTALFRVIVLLVLSLFFMWNMHIPLTLIALSTFPAIILNSILFDRRIEKTFRIIMKVKESCHQNYKKI